MLARARSASCDAPAGIAPREPQAELAATMPARIKRSSDVVIELMNKESFRVTLPTVRELPARVLPARIVFPDNKLPLLLRFFPGAWIVGTELDFWVKKERQWCLAGGALLVGPEQCRDEGGVDVHVAFENACHALGFDGTNVTKPELYLKHGGIGASASGRKGGPGIVTVMSGLVAAFEPAELTFVLAHELGHLAFSHSLSTFFSNQLLGLVMPQAIKSVLWLHPEFGKHLLSYSLATQLLNLLFARFSRTCEYTADRCGLLAVRDVKVAVSALAKLSGGRVVDQSALQEQFHRRAEATWTLALLHGLDVAFSSHPTIEQRITHLVEFAGSDEYAQIVQEADDGEQCEPRAAATSIGRNTDVLVVRSPTSKHWLLEMMCDAGVSIIYVGTALGALHRVFFTQQNQQNANNAAAENMKATVSMILGGCRRLISGHSGLPDLLPLIAVKMRSLLIRSV